MIHVKSDSSKEREKWNRWALIAGGDVPKKILSNHSNNVIFYQRIEQALCLHAPRPPSSLSLSLSLFSICLISRSLLSSLSLSLNLSLSLSVFLLSLSLCPPYLLSISLFLPPPPPLSLSLMSLSLSLSLFLSFSISLFLSLSLSLTFAFKVATIFSLAELCSLLCSFSCFWSRSTEATWSFCAFSASVCKQEKYVSQNFFFVAIMQEVHQVRKFIFT